SLYNVYVIISQVLFDMVSSYSSGHLRILGSKCSNDQECLADVTYSRCQAGRCVCLPYYAEYNKTMCVQSTLLGFDCLVKEQCSMKVANSVCLRGTCRCEKGYLQFRRHTCLSPASPGDVCYSDAHCRLWDSDTHCDFLIPNLFGRCQCNPPMKQRGNSCIHPNSPPTGSDTSASGPSAPDIPNSSAWASSDNDAAWLPVTSTQSITTAIPVTTTTKPPQILTNDIPSSKSTPSPVLQEHASTLSTTLTDFDQTSASENVIIETTMAELSTEDTLTETSTMNVDDSVPLFSQLSEESSQIPQQDGTVEPEISVETTTMENGVSKSEEETSTYQPATTE
ncbi:hypothetical protein L9F63_019057, partial [Diploptera punctata]